MLSCNDAVLLKKEYKKLKSKLDDAYAGDRFIEKSVDESIARLNDIIKVQKFKSKGHFSSSHKFASDISSKDFFLDACLSKETKEWRQNLSIKNFNKIPDKNKKEVFDCFFRYDTYGELYNDDIIFLSRGVEDPEYFSPPAIVNIALDVANKQNWFGYSDPLGHIDTRNYIANQEKVRWNNKSITCDNIAVVMGGTHGLDTVLSFIKKRSTTKKDFIVLTPTYAPIIESVNSYFGTRKSALNDSYMVDFNTLSKAIKSDGTIGILLSIPHNPMCSTAYVDIINFVLPLCKKHSKYIIIDEVYVQDKISVIADILSYEKTIVITSYSKSYAIPGLKLGHLIASSDFITKFYRHASTSYGSSPSYLYLVSSCLAQMHNKDFNLENIVAKQCSNVKNVFTEFKLWKKQKQLFNDFNTKQITDAFKNDLNYSVILPNTNSSNIVLRADIQQPAYFTMLQLLTECNVSVMPIECFFPSKYTKHDMRITTSVNPVELHAALSRIKSKMDDIIKTESSNIKCILWDNDGVLVDTEHLFFDATKQALSTICIKANYKDFEDISLGLGQNLIQYYGKKFGFSADKIIKLRDTLYSKMISSGINLNPNIFDSVKKLKEAGFTNVIVTGSDTLNFYSMHKNNKKFLAMFDLIVTRPDYKKPKPATDSYKYAMKKLKVKPAECLIIEDSARGIEAAIRCGCKFIQFNNSKKCQNIFKQIKNKLAK